MTTGEMHFIESYSNEFTLNAIALFLGKPTDQVKLIYESTVPDEVKKDQIPKDFLWAEVKRSRGRPLKNPDQPKKPTNNRVFLHIPEEMEPPKPKTVRPPAVYDNTPSLYDFVDQLHGRRLSSQKKNTNGLNSIYKF